MNIGIIGFGNMGSMLANGFLKSNILNENHLYIHTRTPERVDKFLSKNKNVVYAENVEFLVSQCNLIFICVKPLDCIKFLSQINHQLINYQHLVSIAGAVSIADIESIYLGKITKLMPTILSDVGAGISLIAHNQNVDENDKSFLQDLLLPLGKTIEVNENEFESLTNLTSSGPGLMAALIAQFAKAGVRYSTLSNKLVEEIVIQTLYGTAKLLIDNQINFSDLIEKVATKGGITEEGIKVIENELPIVMNHVFEATLQKYELFKQKLKKLE